MLRAALILPCLATLSLPAGAQVPAPSPSATTGPIIVIEIRGSIRPDLVPRMRKALEAADPDRQPTGTLLLLDSTGGDGLAAMEVGRMARAAGAHAFVRGRCESACVLILAGAVMRGVSRDRAIAIHRGRLTLTSSGSNVDTARNTEAARALEVADRLTEEYLREMDMPDALFRSIMAVPANLARFLTLGEMTDLRLLGTDSAWLRLRAPAGAAAYGVSAAEFERRLLAAPAACIPGQTSPADFVRCYRRVMKTGG